MSDIMDRPSRLDLLDRKINPIQSSGFFTYVVNHAWCLSARLDAWCLNCELDAIYTQKSMSLDCYIQSQTLASLIDSQLHSSRFWHDSRQMAPINSPYLMWLSSPVVTALTVLSRLDFRPKGSHHYKKGGGALMTMSSALYKPLKKHEQGIHTHSLPQKNSESYPRWFLT